MSILQPCHISQLFLGLIICLIKPLVNSEHEFVRLGLLDHVNLFSDQRSIVASAGLLPNWSCGLCPDMSFRFLELVDLFHYVFLYVFDLLLRLDDDLIGAFWYLYWHQGRSRILKYEFCLRTQEHGRSSRMLTFFICSFDGNSALRRFFGRRSKRLTHCWDNLDSLVILRNTVVVPRALEVLIDVEQRLLGLLGLSVFYSVIDSVFLDLLGAEFRHLTSALLLPGFAHISAVQSYRSLQRDIGKCDGFLGAHFFRDFAYLYYLFVDLLQLLSFALPLSLFPLQAHICCVLPNIKQLLVQASMTGSLWAVMRAFS